MNYKKIAKKTGRLIHDLPDIVKEGWKEDRKHIAKDVGDFYFGLGKSFINTTKSITKKLHGN